MSVERWCLLEGCWITNDSAMWYSNASDFTNTVYAPIAPIIYPVALTLTGSKRWKARQGTVDHPRERGSKPRGQYCPDTSQYCFFRKSCISQEEHCKSNIAAADAGERSMVDTIFVFIGFVQAARRAR